MSLTFLLVSLAANPGVSLSRVADDSTTVIALQRSQWIAEQLLAALPDFVRNSPRPRIQELLSEVRHDQTRAAREGRNAVFEAAVLLNYSELVRLAKEYLGENNLRFKSLRDTSKFEFPVAYTGGIRNRAARVAFSETLLPFEEMLDVGRRANEMIDALAKLDKVDPYQNNKWKRELVSLRKSLREADEAIRMPAQLNKVIPEATLLGIYARLVALSVQFGR